MICTCNICGKPAINLDAVHVFKETKCRSCKHQGLIYVSVSGYNGSCNRIMQCPKCYLVQER